MAKVSKGLKMLGLLLLAAALCVAGLNLWGEAQAEKAAGEALEALLPALLEEAPAQENAPEDAQAGEAQTALYRAYPQMQMPVKMAEGEAYIGVLEIPALGLMLPIISEWSMEKLAICPCRYSGSAYENDLVILGHNYAGHFRELKNLQAGDAVLLTDMDGNLFSYEVLYQETLAPEAVEEMVTADGWDMTLFTCTTGGQNRVAVRCALQ